MKDCSTSWNKNSLRRVNTQAPLFNIWAGWALALMVLLPLMPIGQANVSLFCEGANNRLCLPHRKEDTHASSPVNTEVVARASKSVAGPSGVCGGLVQACCVCVHVYVCVHTCMRRSCACVCVWSFVSVHPCVFVASRKLNSVLGGLMLNAGCLGPHLISLVGQSSLWHWHT